MDKQIIDYFFEKGFEELDFTTDTLLFQMKLDSRIPHYEPYLVVGVSIGEFLWFHSQLIVFNRVLDVIQPICIGSIESLKASLATYDLFNELVNVKSL